MFSKLSQIDFASYADGNTPYVEVNNVDDVITTILENNPIQLFKSFSDKQMNEGQQIRHLISNDEKVLW